MDPLRKAVKGYTDRSRWSEDEEGPVLVVDIKGEGGGAPSPNEFPGGRPVSDEEWEAYEDDDGPVEEEGEDSGPGPVDINAARKRFAEEKAQGMDPQWPYPNDPVDEEEEAGYWRQFNTDAAGNLKKYGVSPDELGKLHEQLLSQDVDPVAVSVTYLMRNFGMRPEEATAAKRQLMDTYWPYEESPEDPVDDGVSAP